MMWISHEFYETQIRKSNRFSLVLECNEASHSIDKHLWHFEQSKFVISFFIHCLALCSEIHCATHHFHPIGEQKCLRHFWQLSWNLVFSPCPFKACLHDYVSTRWFFCSFSINLLISTQGEFISGILLNSDLTTSLIIVKVHKPFEAVKKFSSKKTFPVFVCS